METLILYIFISSVILLGVNTCPDMGVPLHGSRDLPSSRTSEQLAPGTVIHFSCDEGYLLDGPPKIICTQEGQWLPSHYPTCIAEDPCSLDPCHNGATCVASPGSATGYHCHCTPAYHGDQCEQRSDCALPPDAEVPNSHFTVNGQKSSSPGWYLPGTIITYECNAGYNLDQGATTRQCQEGHWVGEIPECGKLSSCEDPGTPDNAHRCCQDVFYSQVRLSFYCEEGYEITGSLERTCQFDGTWSGVQPVCTKVTPAPTPDSKNMFNTETLTIVMATTGSILGILVVTVIITSRHCRSRTQGVARGYHSMLEARLARLNGDSDATALLAVTDNINVMLPSYDEAVSNVRGSNHGVPGVGRSTEEQRHGDDIRSSVQGRPLPPLPPPPSSTRCASSRRTRLARSRRSIIRQQRQSLPSPPPYDDNDVEPIDISSSSNQAEGNGEELADNVENHQQVTHSTVGNDLYAEVTIRQDDEPEHRGSCDDMNNNSDDELLPLEQPN